MRKQAYIQNYVPIQYNIYICMYKVLALILTYCKNLLHVCNFCTMARKDEEFYYKNLKIKDDIFHYFRSR